MGEFTRDIDIDCSYNHRAKFAELRYLERSLGKSGQLALRPILMATGKDLWQLQWLQH